MSIEQREAPRTIVDTHQVMVCDAKCGAEMVVDEPYILPMGWLRVGWSDVDGQERRDFNSWACLANYAARRKGPS